METITQFNTALLFTIGAIIFFISTVLYLFLTVLKFKHQMIELQDTIEILQASVGIERSELTK